MTDADIVRDATAELADAADEKLGVRADDLRAAVLGVFFRLVAERDALLRATAFASECLAEVGAVCPVCDELYVHVDGCPIGEARSALQALGGAV